jgi:hypothetical protein
MFGCWQSVATSAPSEKVFNAADKVVNQKRFRLDPVTVDLLISLWGNKGFVEWGDDISSLSISRFFMVTQCL